MATISDDSPRPCTWVIVPAAGLGKRFKSKEPKQFIPIAGKSVLHYTLEILGNSPLVRGIVLVVPRDHMDKPNLLTPLLRKSIQIIVCAGGKTRTDSVRCALARISQECDIILVHDGVRPAISTNLISRVALTALDQGACVPVVHPTETIKEVANNGLVIRTLARKRLRVVQTPQGFKRNVLERAYKWLDEQTPGIDFTDDAALVEASGQRVVTIEGENTNLKVTVPSDLTRLGLISPRVGFGYDVHKLVDNRPLILGGVRIPYTQGLMGHSDADVALHALADAILGGAAMGDIGQMFPPKDPQFAGANSIWLLGKVIERVKDAYFCVSSVDITIVAERPRLAPYFSIIKETIAQVLRVDTSVVSIKATTEEGLGFTGKGEGIAAYATAVLVPCVGNINHV